MNTSIDRSGRAVRPGDFTVYAHNPGRCASLRPGRMINIVGKAARRLGGAGYAEWRIEVRGLDEDRRGRGRAGRVMNEGSLQHPERIVPASDPIPQHLKDVLLGAT